MRANNVLGLIFSSTYDSALPEITARRTMGSVPFGGRYRLIDFPLSNFVNCGISKVGVITKSNFQSLLDHLGTGKPWDLSRKNEGMYILPPFSSHGKGVYTSRIEALNGVSGFISRSKEEYVVLCDCNTICNIDMNALLDFHTESGADITIAYRRGLTPNLDSQLTFEFEGDRIVSAPMHRAGGEQSESDYSLNIYVLRKSLLETLVNEALSLNAESFDRDIIQRNISRLVVKGYEIKGFVRTVDSLKSYYGINMELLDFENSRELFNPERPILTKIRDDVPAIYGLGSKVSNSLVANGCVIEGEVENSILFRGVRVAKGAKVSNSIIMQGGFISEGVSVNCTVMDKSCVITPHKTLSGDAKFPICIGKGIII